MVLDGHSRRVAAQAGGMERQTLRDWVIRSNADVSIGVRSGPPIGTNKDPSSYVSGD